MQKLRVGGVPEHFNTPWHLACGQGLFKEGNIDVDFIIYPDGTGAMCRDLSSGKLDLAITLTEGAVKHCVSAGDSVIVAPYVDTPLTWGVYVSQQSQLQHLTALKDKTFAVSRLGSGSHLMALIMAEVKWDRQLQAADFHAVGGIGALCNAVNTGQGDAFLWEVFTTQPWLEKGGIRCIGSYPTPWPCFHATATKAIIQANQSAVFTCLEIVQAVASQLNANHSAAAEKISQYYPLDKDSLLQWLAQTRWSESSKLSLPMLTGVAETLASLDVCELPSHIQDITSTQD